MVERIVQTFSCSGESIGHRLEASHAIQDLFLEALTMLRSR